MPSVSPSRRDVLHGLVGLTAFVLVTGCTSDDNGPDTPGGKGAEPDPDLALVATAIADKQDLLGAYEATLTRHGQLADRLEPIRADHAAHLAALTAIEDQKRVRSDLPAPGPSASATATGASTPAGRDQAVAALAGAELAAAGRRIGQCESARDADLARLLASIGGCEAAHTALLRTGES